MADLDMGNCVAEDERVENGDSLVKDEGLVGQENVSHDNNMDLASFEEKFITESQEGNDDSQGDSGGNLIDIGDVDGRSEQEPVTGATDEGGVVEGNLIDNGDLVETGNTTNGSNDVVDLLGEGGECPVNPEHPESQPETQIDEPVEETPAADRQEIESDSELTETSGAIENGVQPSETADEPESVNSPEEVNQAVEDSNAIDVSDNGPEKALVDTVDNVTLSQQPENGDSGPEKAFVDTVDNVTLSQQPENGDSGPEKAFVDTVDNVTLSQQPENIPMTQPEAETPEPCETGSDVITTSPPDVISETTVVNDVRKGPAVQEAIKAREEAKKKAANGSFKPPQTFVPNMSVTAEVQDYDALTQALGDVRNDGDGVDKKSWVLVGHVDNKPNQIQLVAQDTSGEATIEDFASRLVDDQVMYGFIRMSATVDMNTTVKFVYVHWLGENVPFVRKGRFGVVHGSIVEHFQPFHLQIETGNAEDLSEQEITQRLDESSLQANRILSSDNAEGRQHRGFTQHQLPRSTSGTMRSVAPASAAANISPDVNVAIGNIRDDGNGMTWVIGNFEDGDPRKQLIVHATGEGDVEELKENLLDDQVQYALYRTSDVIDGISTVKFAFIAWIGEQVKPMTKGKVSTVKGAIETAFSPFHIALYPANQSELDESGIKDKVMASSGSKSFVK